MHSPELSIIIPALNEEGSLPLFLGDLSSQQDVEFEVIVSDGGSQDQTEAVTKEFFRDGRLTGTFLVGPPGRGRQLNCGVETATTDWLLFLHADSRFTEPLQLRKALDYIQSQNDTLPERCIAGRFSLRFDVPADKYGFGYYFYETKALMGRKGCIHGDQGMLMATSFFQKIGPFREDLPVMEDSGLAEKIRDMGQWCLLPSTLLTSSRRFEVEGMKERQTLNALMMNFLSIGWYDFFSKAPDVYRQQDNAGALQLQPFFRLIQELLSLMPLRSRFDLWFATGRYVRSQAWQIGLMLDCRSLYRSGNPVLIQPGPWLKWFDSWFERLTDHRAGDFITAVMVRIWFVFRLYS